jgi:hypothetical protein
VSDDSLKSAYELAMERLKVRDAADGVEATKPLTPNQKKTIADLRGRAKAKLAELEILHGKDLAEATEPEKFAELEGAYRTDRTRVNSSLESAIALVRRGKKPEPTF